MARATIAAITGATVAIMHVAYRYPNHWWYDNVAHLLGGVCMGALLPGDRDATARRFLAVATIWEAYEWASGEPRSMGDPEWPMDRKVEDTILDTIVGMVGAYIGGKLTEDI